MLMAVTFNVRVINIELEAFCTTGPGDSVGSDPSAGVRKWLQLGGD